MPSLFPFFVQVRTLRFLGESVAPCRGLLMQNVTARPGASGDQIQRKSWLHDRRVPPTVPKMAIFQSLRSTSTGRRINQFAPPDQRNRQWVKTKPVHRKQQNLAAQKSRPASFRTRPAGCPSLPRIPAQLVLIEADAEARPGGQVDPEIRKAQRLLDQIVDEDLRAEMLAAPAELAQSGEDLQVCGGADRALQQAGAIEGAPGRLGYRRDIARGEQPAVLDELERDDI